MSEYIRTIIRQVIYRWHQECKRDEPRRVVPQSPHGSFWKYISHLIFTPVPILTIATIESLVATESDRPIYELVRKPCSVLSQVQVIWWEYLGSLRCPAILQLSVTGSHTCCRHLFILEICIRLPSPHPPVQCRLWCHLESIQKKHQRAILDKLC